MSHDALGPAGTVLSRNGGESLQVHRLADHPGWLRKMYRPGARTVQADRTLDDLIALPDRVPDPDRARLLDQTAWPVCRVVGVDQRTTGVVFQEAPPSFSTRFTVGPRSTEAVLQVDWLCQPAAACERRGVPYLDVEQRIAVCRSLVEIADVLARHGLVYGDWSYRNAFWSISEQSGFIIDVDSCDFASRKAIQSPAWRDPQLNGDPRIDATTDRYGVALLVARCLTTERDRTKLLPALRQVTETEGRGNLYRVLDACLTATADRRPEVGALLPHLGPVSDRASASAWLPTGANVVDWVDVRTPAASAPSPVAPAPDDNHVVPVSRPKVPVYLVVAEVVIGVLADHPALGVALLFALLVLVFLIII